MDYGAIDIGTNAVLLLVMEKKEKLTELHDFSTITRLGEGLLQNKRLSRTAMERTVRALERYETEIRKRGVVSVFCFGTSAVREAENRDEFIAMARDRTGLEVMVFSEYQEAYYTYLSVQRDHMLEKKDLLIVDIGGGSTEIIQGTEGRFLGYRSLPVGTVKLTELFIRHDPPLPMELEETRRFVEELLSTAPIHPSPSIVGMAGTMTTLAAMDLGLERYDKNRIHGHLLSRDAFGRWIDRLSHISLAERTAIPGMEPGREDVLLQGIILMREIMRSCDTDGVVVSTAGARYGVIYEAEDNALRGVNQNSHRSS
jgi:exopolyphosphatase / guanosine-5'-triphosphate,3'-diphosphate pyrophosphatase